MTHYFTADLHLTHDVVAKHRGFTCSDEHDRIILDGLRSTLKEDDCLFILGDITGRDKDARHAYHLLENVRSETSCSMVLCPGNHDIEGAHRSKPWSTPGYSPWAHIAHFGTIKIAGERALLCHYPYQGDHTKVDRMAQYRPRDYGMTILHGHTHQSNPLTLTDKGTLQVCVGLDAWAMKPVSKERLDRLITAWRSGDY